MYKKKYYKYKNKYLKLVEEGDFDIPDKVDAYDADDLDVMSDNELELDLDSEIEGENEVEENASRFEKLLGFEMKNTDFISENLKQNIWDVGTYYNSRARIYLYSDFEESNFIRLDDDTDKSKILIVDNENDFNDFTEKYGIFSKKDKNIYINWSDVAKKYKGIYLSSSSQGDLEDDIPYLSRTVPNWINYDYNSKFIDKVIIFRKIRSLMNFREISKPFKGKISDEYAIDEKEFARLSDQITHDKILLIDDIMSFDKFTNTYGILISKKDRSYIKIDWNSVDRDFDGFYIDKDIDFYKRFDKAFYKGKLYESWVKINDIEQGVVYIFE
jgi:hypothetical protein